MDVDTIVTEVQEHGFTDFTTAQTLRLINAAYRELLTREPWPFLEKEATVTLSANSDAVSGVPSDFGKVMSFVVTTAGSERRLFPERYNEVKKHYPKDPNPQLPWYYMFLGSTLKVWPKADSSYTCDLKYIARPTALASGGAEGTILLPPEHHELLVVGGVQKGYIKEDDWEAANAARQEFEHLYQQMRNDVWSRQHDTSDYIEIVDIEDIFN